MWQQGVQLDQDLLKDPVTVPCGHNYCFVDQRGRFSCPQCRHTFIPRPFLKENPMLAEVVEKLEHTGLQAIPPDHCYAGPGDVACDVCTGRKLKAVKTCLQCLVSYCDTHLQPHYQSPAFKKHKLVKTLQENICCRHGEVRTFFCRTDQQCICSLCSMEEHKGHQVISAAAERTERQKELHLSLHNIQQRIQEREKNMKAESSINNSADRAVEDSDTIFNELISSIERRRSEVRELIRDQQKREVSCAEELKQEVTELRRRHAELEQFSHTEDHIHFLQRYTSISRISESTHPVSSNIRPLRYFEDVTVAVSKIRDKLEDILKEEWTDISGTVNRVDALLSTSEPKTRDELLQYLCPITLDPNTVHQLLSLSKGNRKVTLMDKPQSYPPHPERFIKWYQVLSREALTGRCYWEVECSGKKVHIAVSSKDISRTGSLDESAFAFNDTSWSLQCNKQSYIFIHRGIKTKIPGSVLSRVGVYLDHSAGTLSFYSVSDMSLLHTVQTTFTQTLYAGFWLPSFRGATAELCDLK